ncbi:MBL fold metallo-hydrolase [Marinivivus vitaminiproducens]|uniref:MBL fold metallo-hydrolase n=1 Tax=Marinivivus vitaminiproducens TaxID=3035935 RepID=UPI0027A86D41|nr:MBL fold metallo-hydrolase [Geminicoccaceae bacterium SCSIO 64248]
MDLPVVSPWFRARRIAPDLWQIDEPATDPLIRANIFLVRDEACDLLIDAGMGIAELAPVIEAITGRPPLAVATHAHVDHVGGLHEFAERAAHTLAQPMLERPDPATSLFSRDLPPGLGEGLRDAGYPPLPDLLITGVPATGYDPTGYRLRPAPATRLLAEGEVIEAGTRRYEILHLPGHSPDGIALYDRAEGVLFAGDAVYDGTLLHKGEGMSLPDYVRTLERLLDLPLTTVHGGHGESFGRARLQAIGRHYLNLWERGRP